MMASAVLERYHRLVQSGVIRFDPAQEKFATRMDALQQALGAYRPAQKSNAFGWLLGGKSATIAAPRGVYIWGEVGRGKTMLMDLFYEGVSVEKKRRVHFHVFMADVHRRIHEWREKKRIGGVKGNDPVEPVAADLASGATVLCFDEFAVTDIADAMLLGRLFQALFARGVVVVATSNVAPQDLYRDGLNRALFLPFIAMLQEKMDVARLDAHADFRLDKLAAADVYFTPDDARARQAFDRLFKSLTGQAEGAPMNLIVFGRKLQIAEAANGVARFSYADLCLAPLGAADFIEIARIFKTVMIFGVPQFDPARRNEVKRFILLIDALYDHQVHVVLAAAAPLETLYQNGEGREAFEFQRTVSRLTEMRSEAYLALPHRVCFGASADTGGLVET